MKTTDVIAYIKGQYLGETGYPLNEEAEKVVNNCYQARDAILTMSEGRDKTDILTEITYMTEELALYRVVANDPGAWENFLSTLKINKVTARDIQSIRSIVGTTYKTLIKEQEIACIEEQESTILRGIKSYTAENGRDGIILHITYM